MNKHDVVYLKAAKLIASLSKDENTQVGCKIMSANGEPVSEGRNGASRRMNDAIVPHGRDAKTLELNDGTTFDSNKYPFMLHAEQNALLFARHREDLQGATAYITHHPCKVCANMLSQAGIAKVVIPENSIVKSASDDIEVNSARYILEKSGIEVIEIDPTIIEEQS